MSLTQAQRLVEIHNLPTPALDYLGALQEELEATRPPERASRAQINTWLRRHGIQALVRSRPAAMAALGLLTKVDLRGLLEHLLISNVSVDDVSQLVGDLVGAAVQPKTIRLFQHYFWSFDRLSTTEALSFFGAYPEIEGEVLLACYRRKDKFFALWKLGFTFELDREEAFRNMFVEGCMRFTELRDKPGDVRVAKQAKLWEEVVMSADAKLAGDSAEFRSLLQELQSIGINLGARKISSVDELVRKAEEEERNNE